MSWKRALTAACVCSVVALAALGARAPQSDWRPLFNGKNLDGWYMFLQKHGRDSDPTRVLTIEDDGVLHVYKHDRNGAEVVMGYMGTNEKFGDYHLRLQYRWGKNQFKPRYLYKPDAGIYYHHVTEDLVWPQAMQFQVELNGVGDMLTVGAIRLDTTIDPASKAEDWQEYLPADQGGVAYTTSGKGVSYTRKRENHERDGWNTVDLICKGSSAAQLVNGHLVNRCENISAQDPKSPDNWTPLTAGRILIEFEASEMFYRDIEIRALDSDESLDAAITRAGREQPSP